MNIPAKMDAYKETHLALPARLGIMPSILNTVVGNRKDT
jgi:hypothetical protein